MLATAEGSVRGRFALVCYVPEPLGSAIGKLAHELCGVARPEAHITILPPRPLHRSLDEISNIVRSTLERVPAFEVGLADVCRFDGTNVLYLNLSEGNETIHRLHDTLNRGDLAYDEPFEFRPHLTLSDPLAEADVEAAQRQAELMWKSFGVSQFRFDEIVFLHIAPGDANGQWRRQWSIRLSKAAPAQSGV
ncbi:MAG TPA: 2'-5' RNA ligase family protein [Bryobacteraceae bacterium]|jgi:2'-5' RNA ligase|nr:2'-5' RNA ligase family protein [Bryobacteraceae bacterium]